MVAQVASVVQSAAGSTPRGPSGPRGPFGPAPSGPTAGPGAGPSKDVLRAAVGALQRGEIVTIGEAVVCRGVGAGQTLT